MSTAVNPITSPGATTPQTNSSTTGKVDPLANESTFLTLLVSQLKNQDPLNPVDSNQFVSQLTQYSQLEQLIGIHADTSSLKSDVTDANTTSTNSTNGAQ